MCLNWLFVTRQMFIWDENRVFLGYSYLFPFPSFIGSLSFILWLNSSFQALLFTFLATLFRYRWFITQPCFTWACAQKQCDQGWHCSLISCSQTKGWVMHVLSWEHLGDSLRDGFLVILSSTFHLFTLLDLNGVCSALEYIWVQALTKYFLWYIYEVHNLILVRKNF